MIEPFLSAVPVLQKLESAGFEAYFVGGAVRDYLLRKPINDVDIATSATPEEVKKVFPRTIDIGIEHGTILVFFQKESYEITTFRSEKEYLDFRRPKEVSFIRSLTEDLERRDFTMNAIAMDRDGNLIDPFNGQLAIQEKSIETVGKAEERFQEDALRMMRAVRFMSQLSFTISNGTLKSLVNLVHLLDKIAIERKRAEFEKLLVGTNRHNAFKVMIESDLYSFLPGLENQREQIKKLQTFECEGLNKTEMWSLLIYCLNLEGKTIELFLRNWRLPLKDIRDIQHIVLNMNKRLKQEWSVYDLYLAKCEPLLSVEKLHLVINGIKEDKSISHWQNVYDRLPIKERTEMDVTGRDLMVWFNNGGGPWLKESLSQIEKAIVEGKVLNKKEKIKEWLMECNQK